MFMPLSGSRPAFDNRSTKPSRRSHLAPRDHFPLAVSPFLAHETGGLDFDFSSIYNLDMERDEARSRFLERVSSDCIAVRVRLINRVVTALYDEAMRPHGIRQARRTSWWSWPARKRGPRIICWLLRLEKSTLSRDVESHEVQRLGWSPTRQPGDGTRCSGSRRRD